MLIRGRFTPITKLGLVLLGGEGHLDPAIEGALFQECLGSQTSRCNCRVSSPQETLSLPTARSILWAQGLLGLRDPASRVP